MDIIRVTEGKASKGDITKLYNGKTDKRNRAEE